MPLSLNMIEQRLENREYETMEQLESDLKRMVQNAKDYNHSKSPIFEDAERIRKALSNFMPKHNPAYLRPDYRAYPTPIPQDLLDRQRASSAVSEAHTPTEKVKLVFSRSRRSEATPATLTRKDLKQDYLNFLKELSEQEDAMYDYPERGTDNSNCTDPAYSNFEERVSKKDYPDYYKVIKKPTSISDVRALVESDAIPDWDTLAKEVRLIWDNAKEYNQEGSDIYIMAEKLEVSDMPSLNMLLLRSTDMVRTENAVSRCCTTPKSQVVPVATEAEGPEAHNGLVHSNTNSCGRHHRQ